MTVFYSILKMLEINSQIFCIRIQFQSSKPPLYWFKSFEFWTFVLVSNFVLIISYLAAGGLDGLNNLEITGAAAQVAGNPIPNLLL